MYLCMVATQTFLFSSMESLQAYSARYQVGSSSISEASRTRSFGVSVHSLRDFRPATHAEARQFRSRWLIIDAWRTVAVDGTTLTEALAYPVHGTLRELQRTHDVRHAHPSIHAFFSGIKAPPLKYKVSCPGNLETNNAMKIHEVSISDAYAWHPRCISLLMMAQTSGALTKRPSYRLNAFSTTLREFHGGASSALHSRWPMEWF